VLHQTLYIIGRDLDYRKRSRSDKALLIKSFSTSSDTTCEVPNKQIFLAC
ncbi:hypothetical protein Tco_1518272, partial [Tanacetum coccineum]